MKFDMPFKTAYAASGNYYLANHFTVWYANAENWRTVWLLSHSYSTKSINTADFINKVETRELPAEVLPITYDVTSMFTNIELGEWLSAVDETYKNANKPQIDIPNPETEDLVLLKYVLENNSFEFN